MGEEIKDTGTGTEEATDQNVSLLDALQADETDPTQEAGDGGKDTTPPAEAQPGETDQDSDTKEGDSKSSEGDADEKGAATPKSEEDIQREAREALGLHNSEPETAEYLKAQLSASSAEAKRLTAERKAIDEFMQSRGLSIASSQKGIGVVAVDGYKSPESMAAIDKASTLSKDDRTLAVEDPDQFARQIAERAVEAATADRLVPTMQNDEVRIPEEMRPVIALQLAAAKGKDGKDVCPDFQALQPYVDAMLDDPSTPEEFRAMAMKSQDSYRFALRALYGIVHQKIAPILAQAQDQKSQLEKKKEAAKKDISLTDEKTQAGKRVAKSGNTEKTEADEIMSAGETW